jgi:hypothetical protein
MNVIFATCEKYSKEAAKTAESIKKYWKSSHIIVLADFEFECRFIDELIAYGEDLGWNQALAEFFKTRSNEEYFILWMDDLLVIDAPEEEFINEFLASLTRLDYDYCSLYAPPAIRLKQFANISSKIIAATEVGKYPVSTMCSLFKVGFFKNILIDTKTPWEFEKLASKKLKTMDGKYKLYDLSSNLFTLSNMIIKGRCVLWRVSNKNAVSFKKNRSCYYSLWYGLRIIIHAIINVNLIKFFKNIFK